MRVAVTARCQFSMFSSSQANSTMAVAELLKLQGHDVTLLSVVSEALWWDDIKLLKEEWTGKVQTIGSVTEPFDICFEVGQMLDTEEQRRKVAKASVLLIRKHAVLDEIEHSLFPTSNFTRDWRGLSEIWCFDQSCSNDDIQVLETLSRLPVYRVPYVWTPNIVEKHRQEMQSPLWIQTTNGYLEQEKKSVSPWVLHIAETNTTAASSCTLPTLITREIALQKEVPISRLRIHNADHVYKSKFFQDNVWRHARVEDLSGEFIGRQRAIDWVYEPMSCVVSHQRFVSFRPMLLDLAWVGVPFLHNSFVMRDIGHGLERFYYNDNRISEAAVAMKNIHSDFQSKTGYFTIDSLNGIRRVLLERFTPFSVSVQNGWKEAMGRLINRPVAVKSPEPAPVTVTAPVPKQESVEKKRPNTITVGFSDMWDSFNPGYNFFTLLLEEAGRHLSPPLKIVGVESSPSSNPCPDVLIFGPFGDTWTKIPPTVPKVHFTGENTAPMSAPDVKLNLCFPHFDMTTEDYLRFPLWILEIDWFGANLDKIVNPKPIPVDRCTKVYTEELERKKKFCAFVVSNPCNPLRNAAFQWLNQYKLVDSAGRLFNTMGDVLAAGPGGGGGELKKFEFLKDYKFCLCFENSSSPGYVTEKLLHAKAAGCIPIYWGDPKVNRDFNTSGFISAQDIRTPMELIEAVKKVDEDDELWKKMYSVPALDEYKLEWTRRTLSELARRIIKISFGADSKDGWISAIPRFLGAQTSEEAEKMRTERELTPVSITIGSNTGNVIETPVVCTFVTRRFLPSLQLWLTALNAQRKAIPSLEARVYIGEDVPRESVDTIVGAYNFVSIHEIPKEAPSDFQDLWDPQHFSWKIWIYNTLARDESLSDRMILYMDAGCFLSRWPTEWMLKAQKENICFLLDSRQKNEQWCHETFCRALNVSAEEKSGNQIVAGILMFRSGDQTVRDLMAEAWKWAQKREVIVGEKWSGTLADGRPYGHRHDQSILSVLRLRYGCATYPLDSVYCDVSLRRTYQTGRAIYCHRGMFKLNAPFTDGIDDCYIINLDRRTDRMDRLYATTPELKERATRYSAVEGKKIQLTPALARLFRPHDFMWKKAIMGCALSHLGLWWKLVNEHPDIQNFFILEDDVKLRPEWEARWKAAVPHLPEDWDIIYFGGILPPNRAGFEHCKERVNEHFSRVAKNSFFGQTTPNRYFHWCAYAYVLSRRGAVKVLEVLKGHDGYWTSADHMLCNPVDHINMYFLDPLVAGCYQDDDPKYANSSFNDFNRIDSFDSDLWNNDERFTKEEVEQNMLAAGDSDIDIPRALHDALNATVIVTEKKEAEPQKQEEPKILRASPLSTPPSPLKHRIVCLEEHNLDIAQLHEKEWIYELFGKPTFLPVEKIRADHRLKEGETPIVIVQRPHTEKYRSLLELWNSRGYKFFVFHLSDEHRNDDISFYSLEGCLKVVRMYDRADITEEMRKKVIIVPLGYHWTLRGGGCPMPLERTPRLPFRNTRWSFFGTAWAGRQEKLAPLMKMEPHRVRFLDGWNAENMVKHDEYIGSFLDSVFIPCPGGQNPETYRLYEALECGCVPIVVREPGDELYVEMLKKNIHLLAVSSWEEAFLLMNQLYNDKNLLETYRNNLLIGYRLWKEKLIQEIKTGFNL